MVHFQPARFNEKKKIIKNLLVKNKREEMKIYPNLAYLNKIKLKNYDKLKYFTREERK